MALIYSNTIIPVETVDNLDSARYLFGVTADDTGVLVDLKEVISSMTADTLDKLDRSSDAPVTISALREYFSERPRYFYGKDGDPGPQGTQGTQGTQGIQGTQGDRGESGDDVIVNRTDEAHFTIIKGSQGIQGTQGVQGTDGYRGIKGNSIGTVDYIISDAERSDTYFNAMLREPSDRLEREHGDYLTDLALIISGDLEVSGNIITNYIAYGT